MSLRPEIRSWLASSQYLFGKNIEWINYLYYNQQKLLNFTGDALKALGEQVSATSRIAWQNRQVLEEGVCYFFGEKSVIPINTEQGGSFFIPINTKQIGLSICLELLFCTNWYKGCYSNCYIGYNCMLHFSLYWKGIWSGYGDPNGVLWQDKVGDIIYRTDGAQGRDLTSYTGQCRNFECNLNNIILCPIR